MTMHRSSNIRRPRCPPTSRARPALPPDPARCSALQDEISPERCDHNTPFVTMSFEPLSACIECVEGPEEDTPPCMVHLPQLGQLVTKPLQVHTRTSQMSRDVFAANLQKILAELALVQNASKYVIGLANLVEALVGDVSSNIIATLYHDALAIEKQGVENFTSTPGRRPAPPKQQFCFVNPFRREKLHDHQQIKRTLEGGGLVFRQQISQNSARHLAAFASDLASRLWNARTLALVAKDSHVIFLEYTAHLFLGVASTPCNCGGCCLGTCAAPRFPPTCSLHGHCRMHLTMTICRVSLIISAAKSLGTAK